MKRFVGIRVREPSRFIKGTFRTQDIGRKGHSTRIAGKLKSTGKYATQAFRVAKTDVKKAGGVKMTSLGKSLSKRGKFIRKGADYKFKPY